MVRSSGPVKMRESTFVWPLGVDGRLGKSDEVEGEDVDWVGTLAFGAAAASAYFS
jgi:hypothetical protein